METAMSKTKYGFTPKYLTQNEKPWFPLMGEIHYSRYHRKYWKEAVLKMKAGGIHVISTYVFWFHHEEVEGEYDFIGNKDLRIFVETVGKCNVKLFLRIGPWSHGEARNRGLPDWLLQKDFEVRTNDERYFAEVKRYYEKIAEQGYSLLLRDMDTMLKAYPPLLAAPQGFHYIGDKDGRLLKREKPMRFIKSKQNQSICSIFKLI